MTAGKPGRGSEPLVDEPVSQWQLTLYLIKGGGGTGFDMFQSLLKRAPTKPDMGPRVAKRSGSHKASLKGLSEFLSAAAWDSVCSSFKCTPSAALALPGPIQGRGRLTVRSPF